MVAQEVGVDAVSSAQIEGAFEVLAVLYVGVVVVCWCCCCMLVLLCCMLVLLCCMLVLLHVSVVVVCCISFCMYSWQFTNVSQTPTKAPLKRLQHHSNTPLHLSSSSLTPCTSKHRGWITSRFPLGNCIATHVPALATKRDPFSTLLAVSAVDDSLVGSVNSGGMDG